MLSTETKRLAQVVGHGHIQLIAIFTRNRGKVCLYVDVHKAVTLLVFQCQRCIVVFLCTAQKCGEHSVEGIRALLELLAGPGAFFRVSNLCDA